MAEPGRGEIGTQAVAGASALVRLASKSPLKLVPSRDRGACVRVHAATFGGGLLAGDRVALDVTVGAGSTLCLGTSAPGKVYRSDDGRTSVQELTARVEAGALLGLVPAPIACFAGARYSQRVSVDLTTDASLILVDSLTSGRVARGERWAFDAFESRTRVSVGGRLVLHEALRLGADAREKLREFEALSIVVLAGPRVAAEAKAIARGLAGPAPRRDADVLEAANEWPWGTILRIAAKDVSQLEGSLSRILAPVLAVLAGGDDWHGPW